MDALSFYFETYVERDVRSLIRLKDLSLFQKFVRLCAGRVACVLNLSSLSNEVGVSHTTAREWLSILEASYIIFLLRPHYNINFLDISSVTVIVICAFLTTQGCQ